MKRILYPNEGQSDPIEQEERIMGKRLLASVASIAAAFALFAGMLVTGALAGAQDSGTPIPEDDVPRPAHIHSGTCEELGDVVYPLNDVTGVTIQGSPVASPIVENPASPEVVQGEVVIESITEVDASLDDILGAEHAVNVHASAENIDVYIACGDITGEPTDGMLAIDLEEQNDSGWAGGAVLEDNGDGTTTVTITLQDTGVPATPGS